MNDRFRILFLSMLTQSDFFEPLDKYQPKEDLLVLVKTTLPDAWRIVRSGIWYQALPPIVEYPYQGWKIHVSATANDAMSILGSVATVCRNQSVSFKFACDQSMLLLMNSKLWDRGASGKFVTIYPRDQTQFHLVIQDLYTKLRAFDGPYILSDRRYRDCKVLYYRYGGMNSIERIQHDGAWLPVLISPEGHEVPDLRLPYFCPPPWAHDPFPSDDVEDLGLLLKNGRYEIIKPLWFSNTGGVYLASDQSTGREVVIKEVRPHTAGGPRNPNAVCLLEKEWRILQKLRNTGVVPQPLDLFMEWEHFFLVESYVPGQTLQAFSAANNVFFRVQPDEHQLQSYYDKVRTIIVNLMKAIQALHLQNVVFGDISPNNVIVNQDNLTVTLVDLEGAYEPGVDGSATLFTPGFRHRDRQAVDAPAFEDDFYAVGSICLSLLSPSGSIVELMPDAHQGFLNELKQDYGLPAELTATIVTLMDMATKGDHSRHVAVAMADLENASLRPTVPIAPAQPGLKEISDLPDAIGRFILANMTYERRDRLFPADPEICHPINVAHGALGVAYALKRILGGVPGHVAEWIHRHEAMPSVCPPGLYLGLSGIAWALDELGFSDEAMLALRKAENHPMLLKSADVFHGAAGFGLTNLQFWQRTQTQRFLDTAAWVGGWLLEIKKENERGYYWPTPDGRVRVGYGHGASGIALFFLFLYVSTGKKQFLDAGRRALDFDMSYEVPAQGYVSFPDETENGSVLWPYWLKGTAGIATTLVRYVAVTGSSELRSQLDRILPDTMRKYAMTPGLFQGLAGLGNLLLDCHQFLDDNCFLDEAYRVAKGVLLFRLDKPSGVAFPGDYLYRISTDFGTGSAGIGLFLHRLLHTGDNFNFVPDALLRDALNSKR